ncbi:ABC transporter permease [Gluconacetobacter sp. Hr-1-5]|uniref:ABC transporter permease n=1 Tax=Gluconacetobacter sp. Hr-1-5 TaxID=3395370 RepID=UPI003B51F1C7
MKPSHIGSLAGVALFGLLLGIVLLGLVWLPYDPRAIDLDHVLQSPSATHWLGTDAFGRDVASRAMLGARTSLLIALQTVCATLVAGVPIGVLAGYLRGWTDRLIMIVADAILAFPAMLLALTLVAVLGGNRNAIVIALALSYLPAVVRVVRSSVLSIRERDYVEASKVAGDGALYTMYRHILPNALPPILIIATSLFGWVILYESALSFLGVGVPPPTPTWGNMLAEARPYIGTAPWLSLVPGTCLMLTLLGVNMLGDAIRDRIDPREHA